MKLKTLLACALSLLCSISAFADGKTFKNPVIYSDVPDMDAIRVGNDYWMVSTTNHFSPGAPIMHSTDLVHWETVNYLFETLNESPKNDLEGGNVYSRGQWAASLRFHKGFYYCFFGTGVKSYLYRTTDPRKKWEIIWQCDEYLHDASFFIDDDDRAYLFYNGSHIKLKEFYPDFRPGFNPDGIDTEVIHGEPRGLLEGSHLYKHDGKYYLTCIWWPDGGIRTQVVFRADKIDGDYANNMKIILEDHMGFWRNGRYNGVAQGFFIDTPNGEEWSMMFQDHEAVGRIPFLMPMRWENGWPVLGDENGCIAQELPMPGGGKPCKERITASDEFNKPELDIVWQWNHNPDNSLWSLTERKGWMRLKTGKVVKSLFEARNTLIQRSYGPMSEGSIKMDVKAMKDGDRAGISMFCSEPGSIQVNMDGGKKRLVMTDREKEMFSVDLQSDIVYLKASCDYTTDVAFFSYSYDGKNWKQLGRGFRMIFSTAHFTGNRFAVFNYATKQAGGMVDIDWFHFQRY